MESCGRCVSDFVVRPPHPTAATSSDALPDAAHADKQMQDKFFFVKPVSTVA